jgi:BirA family biotin operon repressor/biotin-[acetyl-CoA-carboxylase] ligase
MLADHQAVEGDWLVALAQDAGRGRQGREWVSATGNFYGSTLVELRSNDPPAATLSLAAGLALIEALDVAVPAEPTMLKWPNDIMIRGRKLAGILLERTGERVAVGFGINLASAPPLHEREAASLGGEIAPEAFAPLLAGAFARLLTLWRTAEAGALARAWQERAHTVGTELKVHISRDDMVCGRYAGLEPDGALRLMLGDGTVEIIRAGDVEL